MTPVQSIEAVLELLADPAHFTQSGNFALDKYEEPAVPWSTSACCWCIVGAFSKVHQIDTAKGNWKDVYPGFEFVQKLMPKNTVLTVYNDTATHEQMMVLLRRALQNALEQAE